MLSCSSAHLAVCADGAPAGTQELGHLVEAGELPQAGFQVQVPVEAQCPLSPHGGAVLVRQCRPDQPGIPGGVR